ncbi:MAG: D-glycero-beta-D-manno-heptose 1,7-bisphosphate 7-phosphatase [Polynucleobacter sp.]|nr:MAG: D-glycero-beta-D-manno-heptose 1,7-bisphosphate 7-phosphatase [Polynucleobacter sp.]
MAAKAPHTKLVILDRDGVINQDSDLYIKSPDEWIPIPGSLEAIAKLNQAGYHIAVATNQSGVGRGLYDMDTLNAIHEKLHRLVAKVGGHIDAIFFCPHTDADHCNCRKPLPGMIQQISERYGIPIKGVPIVGDSVRDLVAGVAVGAEPHLVLTGKGEKARSSGELPPYTAIHQDLMAFANHFIQRS